MHVDFYESIINNKKLCTVSPLISLNQQKFEWSRKEYYLIYISQRDNNLQNVRREFLALAQRTQNVITYRSPDLHLLRENIGVKTYVPRGNIHSAMIQE